MINIIGTIINENGNQIGSTNFVLTVVPDCICSTGSIVITGKNPGAK